jgi:hypothetical protein
MDRLELDADALELKIRFTKGLDTRQTVTGKIYTKDTIIQRKWDEITIPCSGTQMLAIRDATIAYLGPDEPKCHGFIYVNEIEIWGHVTMVPFRRDPR